MKTKTCKLCGAEFEADGNSRYCSKTCSQAAYKKRKREWQIRNRDHLKAYLHKYHLENLDDIHEKRRQYYQANKEIIKAKAKKYRSENRDKIREYFRNYRKEVKS